MQIMKCSLVAAAVTAAVLSVTSGTPLRSRDNGMMVYNFSDLTPGPDLTWTPCYDNFTCSLLEVPLDYANPSVGTTSIAIIKKPSQNASAEDLLINPGGPGGSGVDMVLSGYEAIIAKVGSQFNLVGIDPRGVNNSGPDLTCFPGYPPAARNAFYAEAFAIPDNTSEYGLARSFQMTGAYGEWCSSIYHVNDTAKYANTVAVAHDFLHYIELRAESLGCPPEEAKLWYYGISYGTVLGATFASLFPHRIARMIVDGVVDSEDYYNGGWESAPLDADEAVRAFFKDCFAAGPELCVFHQNATSWEELEQRYLAILDSLKKSPIAVADPVSPTTAALGLIPAAVTWQDLVQNMFAYSYFPIPRFPIIAQVLTELEVGNATSLHAAKSGARIVSPTDSPPYDMREARTLVSCVDAYGRFNASTIEEYTDYIDLMVNTSQYGGLAVASIVGPICRKLNVYPPESQAFSGKPGANKTSVSILWLGNTADPVTPLRSAKKMASLFVDSAVLTANVSGHTLFGVASKCVDDYTRRYMLDATLPPPNAICQVDEKPFFNLAGAATGPAPMAKRWLF
ncbi:alpha/beta-hydrolase [Zopfia rhizophila CBS 207.26]|uniref:Alpha/beta-hydrolase n=1 Tax=Zopfia rhizophila CBS 207.26 TaxID=1314779 RepID=A0A6A6DQ73_9PEZI|nr:alpha/beta-hydrolase [Zopfia rhizophila CBS 207.26]